MAIKIFIMDVDGTLTDSKIYIGNNGEIMKAFNVKDGYGIRMLNNCNIKPIVITNRKSKIVTIRCMELGINLIYQGVKNKLTLLKYIINKLNINNNEIAYIGDDINDIECINYCKYTACPFDAVDEVKEKVKYISIKKGGDGAVRDFIEWLIKNEYIIII